MIAVAFSAGGSTPPRLSIGSVHRLGVAPCQHLTVSSGLLARGTPHFQCGEHVIVRVGRGEMHAELESGRPEQPEERGQRGLASVPLVGGDHRGRYPGPLGQLPLA